MMIQNPRDFQVFAIAAISADGFIASRESSGVSSTSWTSKEDLSRFMTLTKGVGAIVMGSTTLWATYKPGLPLPGRKNYILTKDPAKIWQKYEDSYSAEKIAELQNNPNLVFISATPEGVISQAKKDHHLGIAVCGGTSVYTAFMEAGLLQTLYLTRENSVSFGGKGLPLFSTTPVDEYLATSCELVSEQLANDRGTIFQEWRVRHERKKEEDKRKFKQ